MDELSGKVAVVTGAAGGIGAALDRGARGRWRARSPRGTSTGRVPKISPTGSAGRSSAWRPT